MNFILHKALNVSGEDSIVHRSCKMICFSNNVLPNTFSQGLLARLQLSVKEGLTLC